MVDEVPGLLLTAINLKGEDTAGTIGEIALVEVVVGVVGKRRVVDLLHLWLCLKIVDDLQRVEDVALYTQRQSLQTLQQYPSVERRDAGTLVTKQQRTHAGHERSGQLAKDKAMIRGIGLGEAGELVVLEIVELTAVDDHTT